MSLRLLLAIVISACCVVQAMAQTPRKRGSNGEIEDAEIVIEKDRVIVMPEAQRNFDKITNPLKPAEKVPLNYKVDEFPMTLPPIETKMRMVALKQEPLEKLYNTFIKAGLGNLGTTNLDVYHNSKRTKDYAYGLNFNHFASARGPVSQSGWSHNNLGAYGKYFTDAFTLTGGLSWDRQRYNFYGYDRSVNKERDIDSIKQVFRTIAFNSLLENSNQKAKLKYKAGFDYYGFANRFDASETEMLITANGLYELNGGDRLEVQSSFSLSKISDSASLSRNLVQIRPYYHHQIGALKLVGGVNFAIENDPAFEKSDTIFKPKPENRIHIYPHLHLSYPLTDNNLVAYAMLTGDMQKQNLRQFVATNPFLAPNVILLHTNKLFELRTGVRGNIAQQFSGGAFVSYQTLRHLPFFINNYAGDSSKFVITYDRGKTALIHFNTELAYQHGNDLNTALQLNFFSFNLDELKAPYHFPTFRLDYHLQWNLVDKISVRPEIFYYNGMKALNGKGKEVNIKGFTEVNLKADYHFSQRVTAFIHGLNILNQKNPRYQFYPTRGILVMLGARATI